MSTLLKSRWIAGHLLVIVTVVGFIDLGLWQLRRYDEKVALRDAVAEGQALPPIPLAEAPTGSFRRVEATGTYDAALQTKVLRSQDGESGYEVLTPFLFEEGRAVLVNRGWISLDTEPPPPVATEVTITGTLWPAEEGSGVPEQLTPAVRRIDPEIQAAFADYGFIGEYLVLTGPDAATGTPVLPEVPDVSLGPHMGYAIQWFLFTLVVLVGYPILLTRTVRRRGASPSSPG